LPRWWVILFYLTIAFAVVYVPYYHFGPGMLAGEELQAEIAAAAAARRAAAPTSAAASGPAVDPYAGLMGDETRVAAGKAIYAARCVACHGPDGGGLVGPNLTDRHWKHGRGDMASLVRVVERGVAGTAMTSFKGVLSKDEIVDVSLFVRTLVGTTPANPKAPEGTEYFD
jgi:cytochrome c oxidase cbb3-type subunit 3